MPDQWPPPPPDPDPGWLKRELDAAAEEFDRLCEIFPSFRRAKPRGEGERTP